MFIIQGKEKPMSRFIFRFETQNINTSREIFYSFIPMINETTDMEMQSKCILRQLSICLLSIFEILGQKLEVLLCIFRGIKILWNELTPPPYPHHFALYTH